MKIVVIGGSGLIGSKVVNRHEARRQCRLTRSTAMSTSEPSFEYQSRRRLFVAALAVLGIGAGCEPCVVGLQ
jgi:hypothetical protein